MCAQMVRSAAVLKLPSSLKFDSQDLAIISGIVEFGRRVNDDGLSRGPFPIAVKTMHLLCCADSVFPFCATMRLRQSIQCTTYPVG